MRDITNPMPTRPGASVCEWISTQIEQRDELEKVLRDLAAAEAKWTASIFDDGHEEAAVGLEVAWNEALALLACIEAERKGAV